MFSPGTKKPNFSSRKDRTVRAHPPPLGNGSPVTPLTENRNRETESSIPDRPTTGTPAPWASRLSVLARIPTTKKSDKVDDVDPIQPVYVGEFPQVVRDEQAKMFQKHASGDTNINGGMDKGTSLAWMICGSKLFIWSYLSPAASRECTTLELPSSTLQETDVNKNWLLCILDWDTNKIQQKTSTGVLLCNRKTHTLIYFPNIHSSSSPLTQQIKLSGSVTTSYSFNSLIASPIPGKQNSCIALACSSNGQLSKFICMPTGIHRQDPLTISGAKGYPRSLIWHTPVSKESKRRFLLLTDHEIQCFSIDPSQDSTITNMWAHEIVGDDGDFGIQKGLAGQKKIWPLDLQIDNNGKVITVLIATFCKDRATSSSYTEYSLLTMQYKSGVESSLNTKILEKRSPIEVIIPKARVEDEEFLFSLRLKVGGKPEGSSVILSGDGTATVTRYSQNTSRLYKFDLPYDAGKVLEASVFPSDDGEDGAWAVLTEKAGVWAIPEKAVLLGGVEPPERSLSRKGSSKEGSRSFHVAPRRASSEAWDSGDRHRAAFAGVARRSVQDEESEALLGQFFHGFLQSGEVNGVLTKLQNAGAFEGDGEVNVFARVSKSIVDTLAKHWTTTRGAEIVALSVVSTQLLDKQRKHQKFLQFLALSKCHEELASRQRKSLQIIMEHGEKLSAMIHLRELQNTTGKSTTAYSDFPTELTGSVWDLIQSVGEKARQNTVLLMDRDNAEVFYSKVSELDQLFHSLEKKLPLIITEDMPLQFQIQRACELSTMCVTLLNAAMCYRDENHMWYPSPEGLTPWYCQAMVRVGMWSLASLMVNLLSESRKFEFFWNLELLVKVLLEAYSGAVSAKVEREEEHGGLLEEYWSRRDMLLDSLYQNVKGLSEVGEEENEMVQKLSTNLLAIAKRHEGYQTLWNLCIDHNDLELLRSLMHDSMGPKGGFSNFVFKQMYNNKHFSKLMRLGEEFPEELTIFLKDHQDLLWLHEVYLHEYPSASATLHALALSENDTSAPEIKISDRRRLLNLSKISAMAGGQNGNSNTELKRIEADLHLLRLQERILEVVDGEEGKDENALVSPVELIRMCLRSKKREVALCAFDVFGWTSVSFIRGNVGLLEECWRNAVDQDNWEGMVGEVKSDEEMREVLKGTVVYEAAWRCYGGGGGGFEEVVPLRQESMGEVSVEGILMQHRSFPDAGKLMVMAVMLGSVNGGGVLDGPLPME